MAHDPHNLTLETYQEAAFSTAVYDPEVGLMYTALGLTGEAGEVANKVKKILRGDRSVSEAREDILDELGDVLWYVANVAASLEASLGDVAAQNLIKLAGRRARGVLRGDGDGR